MARVWINKAVVESPEFQSLAALAPCYHSALGALVHAWLLASEGEHFVIEDRSWSPPEFLVEAGFIIRNSDGTHRARDPKIFSRRRNARNAETPKGVWGQCINSSTLSLKNSSASKEEEVSKREVTSNQASKNYQDPLATMEFSFDESRGQFEALTARAFNRKFFIEVPLSIRRLIPTMIACYEGRPEDYKAELELLYESSLSMARRDLPRGQEPTDRAVDAKLLSVIRAHVQRLQGTRQ